VDPTSIADTPCRAFPLRSKKAHATSGRRGSVAGAPGQVQLFKGRANPRSVRKISISKRFTPAAAGDAAAARDRNARLTITLPSNCAVQNN